MSDDDEAVRGHAARREWSELEAAFVRLRAAMLEEIVASDPSQSARREKLYIACQTLDAVKVGILAVVGAGNAAELRKAVTEATAGIAGLSKVTHG